VPVHSTIILLRPAADGPDVTGIYEKRYRNGDVYDWFQYNLVRIWEQPVEEVLAAGVSVLPLAPVAKVEPEKVPEVLMAISERLASETNAEQAATLWAATKVLMGLRYPKEQVEGFTKGAAMIMGIRGIEESSVYQDIFAKGEAEGRVEGRREGQAEGAVDEARTTLLRQGRKKLGPLSEAVQARIAAIRDLDRLNDLLDRILDVSTWDELLPPSAQPE
jgi:predicted transposase YdaD